MRKNMDEPQKHVERKKLDYREGIPYDSTYVKFMNRES